MLAGAVCGVREIYVLPLQHAGNLMKAGGSELLEGCGVLDRDGCRTAERVAPDFVCQVVCEEMQVQADFRPI